MREVFLHQWERHIAPDALQGHVNGVYRLILFSVLTIGSSALGLSLEHLGVLPTMGIVWSGLLLIKGVDNTDIVCTLFSFQCDPLHFFWRC